MRLPEGFIAGGIASGIKAAALDLALVCADRPVPTAAVFTTSAAPAAPVQISRSRVANGRARAVLLNSGCANAATGPDGFDVALDTTAELAGLLGAADEDVLVCSTGIIGTRLPGTTINAALPQLVATASPTGVGAAAEAIMTTDTFPKTAVSSGSPPVVGFAKGAGMIRPDMATMLAVLTTDAVVSADDLQQALHEAVRVSFNALTVDGCMSTNDTVIAMASGSSGVTAGLGDLSRQMTEVCTSLTRQIAADGEGATKVVDVEITGAESPAEARRLGLAVADSALVRSSFAAADPNWGRVVAALGAAGADPARATISYAGVAVAENGVAVDFDGDDLRSRLVDDFTVAVNLGGGAGSATVFTCDLTPAYVLENMETS